MIYQKRDRFIEAIQFTRENFEEVQQFTQGQAINFTIEKRPNGACFCWLEDNNGWKSKVCEGNYIVKTVEKGCYLVVNQHFFHSNYEEVGE